MKYNLFFVFYLFVIFTVSSQSVSDTYRTAINDGDMSNNGIWLPGKSINSHIEGSTYLFSNWVGSYKVISKNGITASLFNLNYNLNSKKLEAFVSKDSVFQYDVSQIDYIKSFNRKYKAINNEFYQELVQGDKISFLKGFYVSVMDGVVNPLTQQYTTPNRYVQKNKYFYLKGEQFEEIKLKKSDVLKAFDDKAELIKKYAKEKNLSFGDENDVASLFRYYNTL